MVKNLEELRKKIDSLDTNLIKTLGLRFKVVEKVGEFKHKNNMPLCQKKRQQEVLKLRIKQAEKIGLDGRFIKKMYNLIFDEALRIEGCKK
jgi:chorismate mutase